MELKSFCKAKDTIKRTKWQPICDRGLIFKQYRELKKPDINKPNTLTMDYRFKQNSQQWTLK